MIYMVTTTYPTKSTIDVGKTYVEAMAKTTPQTKEIGIWLNFGGDGIKSFAIHEVEKGHEDQAFKALTDFFIPFLKIEGFKVNIEPVLTPEDALPLIGITPPDQT